MISLIDNANSIFELTPEYLFMGRVMQPVLVRSQETVRSRDTGMGISYIHQSHYVYNRGTWYTSACTGSTKTCTSSDQLFGPKISIYIYHSHLAGLRENSMINPPIDAEHGSFMELRFEEFVA